MMAAEYNLLYFAANSIFGIFAANYKEILIMIVGRQEEIAELDKLYNSGRPEFVAIYGRRRVGKTFLVKQVLKERITFQHTGVSPVDQDSDKSRMKVQLESFYYALLNQGLEGYKQPKSWMEAFFLLEQLLQNQDTGKRQVVFIDELPWMDTPRSGFLPAFENFWNGWCSGRDNVMLIVCGSATSWILSNLSRSKGGLYGRLTSEIKLSPFTLKECEEYFEHAHIQMSRYDILQSYMVFGGIPYYISYFQKGLSFEQNVDKILFGGKPRLRDEFNRLFAAIFNNPEDSKKIVRLLATRHAGFTREEISKATGIALGGGLTNALAALAESDFIIRYNPYGKAKMTECYKLVDNFCLFWLKYVEIYAHETGFANDNMASDIMRVWHGVAFEEVCLQHIEQIRCALQIAGVRSSISAWSVKGDDDQDGVQIDLLIIRDDHVVNLCEMKFACAPYSISKEEEMRLRHRIEMLKGTLSPKQTVHLTMITTYGVAYGKHCGIVQKEVVMEDLFKY